MIEPFLLGALTAWICEIIKVYKLPCQHPTQATFHSTGNKMCVDCYKLIPMRENKYAKHQR